MKDYRAINAAIRRHCTYVKPVPIEPVSQKRCAYCHVVIPFHRLDQFPAARFCSSNCWSRG